MLPSASPILAALQRQASHANRTSAPTTALNYSSQDANDSHTHFVSIGSAPQQSAAGTHPKSDAGATPPCRALQHVLTRAQRAQIVKWMLETAQSDGSKHIASKAIRQFPSFFRSSINSNLTKASRLWKTRQEYTNDEGKVLLRGTTSTITRVTLRGCKRVNVKDRSGRGRERTAWVSALHDALVSEFHRLRKLGVKFNCKTLRSLAIHITV